MKLVPFQLILPSSSNHLHSVAPVNNFKSAIRRCQKEQVYMNVAIEQKYVFMQPFKIGTMTSHKILRLHIIYVLP